MVRTAIRRTALAATGVAAVVWLVCTGYVLHRVLAADLTASQQRAIAAYSRDPAAAVGEPFPALVVATSLLGVALVVAATYWRHRRWIRSHEESLSSDLEPSEP